MSSVENRIVSIKFDDQQFNQQVAQTLLTLDKLTEKLGNLGSGKGFADINAAANSVNFSGMASGIDKIASKFDALGAIGFSAIQNITTGVLNFVKNTAQNDILGPIITGGRTRALEIQQAQFQFQGLGINVQEVMADALAAVKGTAFGLGDAAKAAAQFGASGIGAGQDMTTALRAIAGTAALTGDSFNDMAVLFTQSAATGKVDNQDLQQFATRGFNAAAAFAKQQGITEAQVHQMATAGTLDFHTFAAAMDAAFGSHATDANQTFQGSLDNLHAALSRLGAAFEGPALFQSRDLFNALTPAIDNVNTALTPLIFTLLSIRGSAISGLINSINNINLTSLTAAIPSISKGIANIVDILKTFGSIIKGAFTDIFPADFGADLVRFADGFERVTEVVKIGVSGASQLTSIFKGLFSILDIGIAIVKGVGTVLGDIVKALLPAGSGLLNLGASAGDFLTKMDQVLVKGGAIQDFFDKLGRGAAAVVGFFSDLAQKVVAFFSAGVGSDVVSTSLDRVGDRLNQTEDAFDRVKGIWDKFLELFKGVGNIFSGVFDAIGNFFSQLKQKIEDELKPADFNSALDAINVGLLGGITVLLKNFFSGGVKFGFGGGVFTQIKSSLNGVTKSLQAMQANLKAKTLLEIAAAMAILAAAIVTLSLINSADLTKALTAMTVGFAELGAMLLLLNKSVLNPTEAFKLSVLSLGLIGLAAAMVIFSTAIAILGKLDLGSLAKGLVGVGAGMLVLVAGTNAIDGDAPGLITAGIAMGIIATSLVILAKAVAAFGTMSWSEIGKGLLGVGVGLAAIVLAMNAIPPESLLSSLGFVAVAVGLRILADAVSAFAKIQFREMVKGIIGITGAILGIALAMTFMPPDLPITAAGLIIMAIALEGIADVVKRMGSIPFGEMAKGLLALAVTLGILVVAVNLMDASVTGAASLLIVAVSLEILADVLKKLGSLSLKELAIGLGAIALTFLVIGGAAILLTEAIPSILGLGIALVAVGAGFALFGLGADLVASAIVAIATSGVAGAKAFVSSIEIILEAVPKIAGLAATLVVAFLQNILNAFPILIKTISALLQQILDVIIKNVPLIAEALQLIFTEGLLLIQNTFPLFVQTGIDALEAILQGLSQNAKQIVDAATSLVTNFAAAIVANMPALVTAAATVIIAFLTELSNHVADIAAAAGTLVGQLAGAMLGEVGAMISTAATLIAAFLQQIADSADQIITAGVNMLIQILFGIASALGNIVGAVANIIITLITEIGKHALEIVQAGVDTITAFIFGLANNAVRLANAAAQAVLQFLTGLDAAIRKYEPQIVAMCIKIGLDIVAGIFFGVINSADNNNIFNWIHGLGQRVVDAAGDIADWVSKIGGKIIEGIWNGVKNGEGFLQQKFSQFGHDLLNFAGAPFGIHFSEPSESTVMAKMGLQIVKGFAAGINNAEPLAESSMLHLSNTITDSFNPDTKSMNAILADFAAGLGDINEFNPTITPVLDLSKIQEGAGNISGILGTGVVSPTVSTSQAVIISAASVAAASGDSAVGASGPTELNFIQTINAPTALSTDEIYRNTRSQITLAKEELSIP